MLIVLEGLDGAGKSTQVKKLKEYLTERCGSLEYIHFPRYDAPVYGDLIGRFLKGEFGSIDAVHPQLVALLFAEDRHRAAPMMREALDAGKVVLLDRYVYSNIAYQCAKLPQLFLDVPIGFVEKSLAAHREGDDRSYLHGSQDIHEADIRFQVAVRDMYRAEAARDAHFLRIDCGDAEGRMLPPDAIFAKVRAAVDPYLA